MRKEYSHSVFYADDAFAGLHIMEDLASTNGNRQSRLQEGRTVKEYFLLELEQSTSAIVIHHPSAKYFVV
ncbi:MAG: hypothetical protein NVS1B11_01980 [Terriglobales bacterium]